MNERPKHHHQRLGLVVIGAYLALIVIMPIAALYELYIGIATNTPMLEGTFNAVGYLFVAVILVIIGIYSAVIRPGFSKP